MAELVANCPRCDATHTTFDVRSQTVTGNQYNWQNRYEVFCVCRHCGKATVFVLFDAGIPQKEHIQAVNGLSNVKGSINGLVRIEGFISLKDATGKEPPEHLPENVRAAFVEGAACHAIKCHNAAGTMFRLCVDLATRPLLPQGEAASLTQKIRRDLGLRLPWLFDNGLLPSGLRDLSLCIREDGNDGAHAGTLSEDDTEDLLDFTIALLERIYTEPQRIELAKTRREKRRAKLKEEAK